MPNKGTSSGAKSLTKTKGGKQVTVAVRFPQRGAAVSVTPGTNASTLQASQRLESGTPTPRSLAEEFTAGALRTVGDRYAQILREGSAPALTQLLRRNRRIIGKALQLLSGE